jgi:hemerythrin-like metal-binding protein
MTSRFELFVTGIPRIDREHKALAELIERAHAVCGIANALHCGGCTLATRDRCTSGVDMLLTTLLAYTREHFRYEEQRMDWLVPTDHAVEHRQAHELISTRLHHAAATFAREQDPAATARSLVDMLQIWLAEHSAELDGVLAAYIGDEGDEEPHID